MIMVHLAEERKDLLASLRLDERPDDDTKASGRTLLRLEQCPCCGGRCLHGHGWRCRFVVTAWWDPSQWGPLWFWRVQCQDCGAVIPLVVDVALPGLFYATAVVIAVVAGRLGGASPDDFEPSKRTQDRWHGRFVRWWAIAQAAGAEIEELKSYRDEPHNLLQAIWSCAQVGIRVVAPSHTPLFAEAVRPGVVRPTITAHQGCKMTC